MKDIDFWKNLSEDKKIKIARLQKKAKFRGFFITLMYLLIFIVMVSVVVLLNGIFVKNSFFGFVTGGLTGMFWAKLYSKGMTEERDRLLLELEEVLQSEND